MEVTLTIDLEPRLSVPKIEEFERKTKAIGSNPSQVVANLIEGFISTPDDVLLQQFGITTPTHREPIVDRTRA